MRFLFGRNKCPKKAIFFGDEENQPNALFEVNASEEHCELIESVWRERWSVCQEYWLIPRRKSSGQRWENLSRVPTYFITLDRKAPFLLLDLTQNSAYIFDKHGLNSVTEVLSNVRFPVTLVNNIVPHSIRFFTCRAALGKWKYPISRGFFDTLIWKKEWRANLSTSKNGDNTLHDGENRSSTVILEIFEIITASFLSARTYSKNSKTC